MHGHSAGSIYEMQHTHTQPLGATFDTVGYSGQDLECSSSILGTYQVNNIIFCRIENIVLDTCSLPCQASLTGPPSQVSQSGTLKTIFFFHLCCLTNLNLMNSLWMWIFQFFCSALSSFHHEFSSSLGGVGHCCTWHVQVPSV